MRWMGFLLLILCGLWLGCSIVQGMRNRLTSLCGWRIFFNRIKTALSYTMEEPILLLGKANDGEMTKIPVNLCIQALSQGEPFDRAWQKGIGHARHLQETDKNCLSGFGEILGSCDLNGQLMQLSLLQAQLEERIQNAQLQMDQKAKLYRDLCVMGSLAAVILLW